MLALNELTHFYARYVTRTIFKKGALGNVYVRLGIALIALAWLAFSAIAVFFFFKDAHFSDREIVLVEFVLSFNTLVWIQLGFLVVKTMFVASDGLVELTAFFPVTNRQRSQSFLIFEAVSVVVVVLYGTFGLCVWSLFQLGLVGLKMVLLTVLLPALFAYSLLSFGHTALSRLIAFTPLRRIAPVISNLALVFPVYITYTSQVTLSRVLQQRYDEGTRTFYWVTSVVDIAAQYNAVIATVISLAITSVFFALTIVLTPKHPPRAASFVSIPLPRFLSPGMLVHLSYVLRSRYTWDALLMAIVLAIVLKTNQLSPGFAVSIVCVVGLYAYGGGEVKAWKNLVRPSAFHRYFLLIFSLASVALALSLPLLLASVSIGIISFSDLFFSVVSAFVGAIVFTMVGVLFPTDRDNPFSALVGLSSLAITVLFLIAIFSLFNLERIVLYAAIIALVAFICGVTIAGIALSQRKERYGS